jgi:hypothetical protein
MLKDSIGSGSEENFSASLPIIETRKRFYGATASERRIQKKLKRKSSKKIDSKYLVEANESVIETKSTERKRRAVEEVKKKSN